MAVYSFPPGIAYAVSTVGDAGTGFDVETGFAIDTVPQVFAEATGVTPVVVRDPITGNPFTLRSGSGGQFPPFLADDTPIVYLKWGAGLPPTAHFSDQVANGVEQAEDARLAAEQALTEILAVRDQINESASEAVAARVAAQEAAASLSNAVAGAIRLLSGQAMPWVAVYDDEEVATAGLTRPSLLLSMERNVPTS